MNSITSAFVYLISIIACNTSLLAQTDNSRSVFDALEYRNIGPSRGGRATTMAGIPDDPTTFYMGATGGGIWKTTDYGQSWKNVSDGYFATPSIGDINVASNPDIIYAGTGSDGIRSNVITGKGVYKSTDAGKTWTFLGLKNAGQIGAVIIHPQNPDTVYVAAIGQAFGPNPERGVFRTYDGGNSWEKILFISDSTGAVDLEFRPEDPNTIYACTWRAERKPYTIISGSQSEGGIYKSTDGGNNWKKLLNGLPSGLIGKSDLAVSISQPDRVWALIEAPAGVGGLYRSDDRGENWELVSTKKELIDRPFYYCNVDVNPRNADAVYVSATQFWYSGNGGKSWKRKNVPHGDNHGIWINPNDTLVAIQVNDGGANITRDGGETWSSQRNQSTAELYQVEVDDQYPYWLYAGQQDNSTISVPSLPPYNSVSGGTNYWMAVGGCETGPAVPKPGNPDIVYANCKGRFGVYNKRTGQEMQYYVGASNMYGHNPKDLKFRFQRVSPIHVSQHNPDVVFHASQYLHKTTDDGKTWEIISPDLTAFDEKTQVISGYPITRDITGEEFYSTIYSVRESPVSEGLIWVGANDGPVSVTRNGGKTWSTVTPDISPGGRVQCVEPSRYDEAKAYVAIYRYLLNDWKPYIYKTEDYGNSWELLTPGTNGIAVDNPTRVIREDPVREGLLYAGTESGVFISLDDGASWGNFQQNLPITPVTDIKLHREDLVLSTMGRGFWILDDISLLRQVEVQEAQVGNSLYKPSDVIRMRYRGTGKNTIPYYPSNGLNIDFFITDTTNHEVLLTFRNEKDEIIRTFTSGNAKKEGSESEANMALDLPSERSESTLQLNLGANRFSWDLTHTPPIRVGSGRNTRGPIAAPGIYHLEMHVGDETLKETFQIKIDPRIVEAGLSLADLQEQESLSLSIRNLLSEASNIAQGIKERRETLGEKIKSGKASKRIRTEDEALAQVESQLMTAEGRYMTPMIIDQISYLYSMLNRADQRPGKDAYDRYNELFQRLESLKSENNKLLSEL